MGQMMGGGMMGGMGGMGGSRGGVSRRGAAGRAHADQDPGPVETEPAALRRVIRGLQEELERQKQDLPPALKP